jgi:hypothetical protein
MPEDWNKSKKAHYDALFYGTILFERRYLIL